MIWLWVAIILMFAGIFGAYFLGKEVGRDERQ